MGLIQFSLIRKTSRQNIRQCETMWRLYMSCWQYFATVLGTALKPHSICISLYFTCMPMRLLILLDKMWFNWRISKILSFLPCQTDYSSDKYEQANKQRHGQHYYHQHPCK